MLIGDSWSISSPGKFQSGNQMMLTLWPVNKIPLLTSIKSLPISSLIDPPNLKQESILAVFNYVPTVDIKNSAGSIEINQESIQKFKSQFFPSGFLHPINLKNNRGFFFILVGLEAPCISKSRCISFQQVINARPFIGGKIFNIRLLTELFPCLSQFSFRFPISSPPHFLSSFLPISIDSIQNSFVIPHRTQDPDAFKDLSTNNHESSKTTQLQTLNWSKEAKLEKWRDELTYVNDYLYLSSETIAINSEKLHQAGITHILNVASKNANSAKDFQFLGIPMLDGGNENILSHLWKSIVFIDDAIAKNGRVLVHCILGSSRSVSIIIGYFMVIYRIPYPVAFNQIRKLRRIASPNPKFTAQLLQLSEVLFDTSTSTCYFSRQKIIPFVITDDKIVPTPNDPSSSSGECVVSFNYLNAESIWKDDKNKKGATITISGLSKEIRKESISTALQLVEDLRHCFNVSNVINDLNNISETSKTVSTDKIFQSPDWSLISRIPENHDKSVFVIIKGKEWTIIAGDEVEDDDYDSMIAECAEKNGLTIPSDYTIESFDPPEFDKEEPRRSLLIEDEEENMS